MTWQAILEGDLRKQTLDAVREVARALPDPPRGGVVDDLDGSLAGGSAGLAIFARYLAKSLGESYDEAEDGFVEHAVSSVHPSDSSLYQGFTGVAWMLEHLGRLEVDPFADDPNREVDAVVADLVDRWDRDFDVVSGLVGYGVYGLERLPRDSGREIVTRVIARLDDRAEKRVGGTVWETLGDWTTEPFRQYQPERSYNLGVAHGAPGVVAFLGRSLAEGIDLERVRTLLGGAVTWLLGQRMSPEEPSCFPRWIEPGVEPVPARTAWCYGDPGVSVALLQAAREQRDQTWEREALAIGEAAARRPFGDSGVADPGMCHGAAGVGHLFNRLFQATGDGAFGEAAISWFRRTLDMRRPDGRLGGFRALHRQPSDGAGYWKDDVGILTGAAGIALALLGAATPVEPEWDRFLLASLRPIGTARVGSDVAEGPSLDAR